MPDFPPDLMDKILRLSSDESHRSFCRMKLVSKHAISDAPFMLRFDSIGDFYTHNADKYTVSQLRNPDSVEMTDFLSQLKIMVDVRPRPRIGVSNWMYAVILRSFINGNSCFSNEDFERTRARTLDSVRERMRLAKYEE